jgi:hypothetical protein
MWVRTPVEATLHQKRGEMVNTAPQRTPTSITELTVV